MCSQAMPYSDTPKPAPHQVSNFGYLLHAKGKQLATPTRHCSLAAHLLVASFYLPVHLFCAVVAISFVILPMQVRIGLHLHIALILHDMV